ncbi:MAG: PEP/pyruvate-binding domain-containing protein [Chloroflexota bacterium]
MTTILPFSKIDKSQLAIAGGKGANLGELVQAKLPVPAGFVIATSAYERFVADSGIQTKIFEQLAAISLTDPKSGQQVSQNIRGLFMNSQIQGEWLAQLKAAYRELVGNGEKAVAVRSSATAEDLPTASFAGQQDTFLNIQSEDALSDAVKKCWASLWTDRAIAYRERQGIDSSGVSIAVIVQKLVPAEASGILFTANPTNGDREELLINATWGLGEAIVSGQVTPDTAVVEKSTLSLSAYDVAEKKVITVRTNDGTDEQPVPDILQNKAVLDQETAVRLAQLGIQIEKHYGMPMDIEWAIANSEISILQARPITSLPPKPLKNVVWEPPAPDTIWMRRQIVEHMPEPLSPLFEDLYLEQGLETAIDMLLDFMKQISGANFAMKDFVPHGFAATINGYAYTSGSFKMSWRLFWAVIRIYSRIFKLIKMPELDYEKAILPNYLAAIDQWRHAVLENKEDEEILQGIAQLATADGSYWFGSAANLGLSRALDSAFDRLLKSFLIRRALPNPDLGSSTFLRGFESKALDAQADMEELANQIRQSPELKTAVFTCPPNQLIKTLHTHPDGAPIVSGLEAYFEAYGHQIYNLDFAAPTQNEDPLPMFLSLQALVKQAPEQDVRTRQAQMAQERETLVKQINERLNPISRHLFNWAWRWTKFYAPYREKVMFYLGSAWPTTRKLAATLGQRLVEAGLLNDPDDIYFLKSEEIKEAIQDRKAGQLASSYSKLAQERRELRQSRTALTALPKVPKDASIKFGPFKFSMFDPIPVGAESDGPLLKGYAVSTGTVTATASVIDSIEAFDQMQPNTILVCTTTTPAWTPLFSQAVGLVTDVGGALAHGSIVAREYGIPAVMGTGVATERIQTGMRLSIDGDKGIVTILE